MITIYLTSDELTQAMIDYLLYKKGTYIADTQLIIDIKDTQTGEYMRIEPWTNGRILINHD